MSAIEELVSGIRKKYGTEDEEPKEEKSYSQMLSELQEKYDTQKTYSQMVTDLQEKYSPMNNTLRTKQVSDWANRYNTAIQGVSDYYKQIGDGYTQDASGGYGAEIDALIADYENIKEYADRFGLVNSQRYVQQLKDLKNAIEHDNAYWAEFASKEAYDKYVEAKAAGEALIDSLPDGKKATIQYGMERDLEKIKKGEPVEQERNILKDAATQTYDVVMGGLAEFNDGLTTTADVILGRPLQALGWENNPISALADYYRDQNEIITAARYQHLNDAGGNAFSKDVSDLFTATFSSVPDFMLAFMTGGASKPGTAAGLGIQAAYEGGNILTKAGITVERMARNPQFWTSFCRTYGSDYEDAKANGADDVTASFAATITSLLNAGVEIGIDGASGIQGLPQDVLDGGINAVVKWVESALEEGGEEVLQGIITNAVAKVMYDSDREVANLEEMGRNFTTGTSVGLLLGGAPMVSSQIGSIGKAHINAQAPEANIVMPNSGTVVNGDTANVRNNGNVEAQTGQVAEAQTGQEVSDMDVLTDTIDPIQSAMADYRKNGKVSNRLAEYILRNDSAVKRLETSVGLELPVTSSGKRAAIKEAVAALVAQQDSIQAQQDAEAEAYAKTEEGQNRNALDAAIKETIGVPMQSNVDITKGNEYDNNTIKQGGNNYAEGLQQNDRTGSIGDPAQGMAGLRSGYGLPIEGWAQPGEMAVDSGIIRVSDKLTAAQQKRGTPTYSVRDTTSTPDIYEQALIAGRESDTENGWCVTPKSAKELKEDNISTFMNANGTVGIGIAPDGDIVAVFKNKNGGPKRALDTAMPIAIELGGNKLDCYGDQLVNLYERYGFIPVASVEFNPEYANDGWTADKGTPRIYMMMHNGESSDIVASKMHTYHRSTKAELDALPHFGKNDYDAAMEYRDKLMKKSLRDSSDMDHGAVGAAEKDFSGKAAYQDLLTDENSQPDRPGDVRPMEVPKTDGYGRKVSEFVANAYGAGVTSDQMAEQIEELVQDGALGYDIRSNKESMQAAADTIKKKGAAAVRNDITKNIAKGKLQDGDIEKAMLLYAVYANKQSQVAQDNAAELMVDLATMANMAGRNLQLFKILRQMTPQGQRMSVQKTIDRYVDQLNSRRGKKHQAQFNISQALMDEYEEAARKDLEEQTEESEKNKAEIEQAIYVNVASQIEATPLERLNAWRYMAMLGNVKTQARNFIGNAAFRPMVNTKRVIGASIESVFLDRSQRTKSVLGFGKEAQNLKKWAAEDAKKPEAANLFSYSAKNGDSVSSQIEDERAIYDTKWLENVRKFVQEVPEAADGIFKRWEYTVSLASFMKARGYTAEQLNSGQVPENVLNEGREYAAQEALKATFNDFNAISNALSKRYKGNQVVLKSLNTLAEGILPFRRTPANIAVRAVEYSPVNLVRAGYNAATKVRSGEMSAATAIDQLASGLTGTGMMALGVALASGLLGVKLVGHLDDDDEENAGHQSYSIEIGGKSYSIDWLAPSNIPLFVGANIYSALADKDPDASGLVEVIDALSMTLEPLLELSCLSSLNDLVESVSYAEDGSKLYTLATTAATSYLNQFIPTLFGQLEQAFEGEKTQVYSDKDTALERSIETTVGQMTKKIPGLDLFQTQKYDNWGNEAKTSSFFDAIINPSYVSEISTDPVDAEISRLNDAQDTNLTVSKPDKTISYTDTSGEKHSNQRLSADQWDTVQQVYGQTAHAILSELIDSESYVALNDAQKAEAFRLAYDYAREKSRIAAIEDYAGFSDSWMEDIDGSEADAIIQKVAGDAFSDAFSSMTNAWKNGRDDTEAVTALENAYAVYQGLTDEQKKAVAESAQGRVDYYLTMRSKGISNETAADLYKTFYNIGNQYDDQTEAAVEWASQLQKAVEKGVITQKQANALKEKMKYYYQVPAEANSYNKIIDAGIDSDTADDLMWLLDGVEGTGAYSTETGKKAVRPIDNIEAVSNSNIGTDEEMETIIRTLYLNDSQEQKLDAVLNLGYNLEEYAAFYRAELDNSKKADFIAAVIGMGYTAKEAENLYYVFNPKKAG